MKTPERRLKKEYSSAKLHAKRDAKRREAEARQRRWDDRPVEERLAIIDRRRGASARETERLTGVQLKSGEDRATFNLKPWKKDEEKEAAKAARRRDR